MLIQFRRLGPVRLHKLSVCIVWILGIVCGVFFSLNVDSLVYSYIRRASDGSLTFLSLIIARVSPIIISVVLTQISYALLFLYVYFKAFSYGFSLCVVLMAYGNAGWLLNILLLFSEFFVICNLLWLWIVSCSKSHGNNYKSLIISIVASTMIGLVDYIFISPYVAVLFNTR